MYSLDGSKLSLPSMVGKVYIIILLLQSSPNRQIKSRRMRWAGHEACMGEEQKVYKVLEDLEDQGVDGRMG
jgi:hypothetical protein